MKITWAPVVLVLLCGGNALARQDVDCGDPDACMQTDSTLEFGKLEVRSVKEEWKTYRWGGAYRELTLTTYGYFPTLLAGRPIVGQEYQKNGTTIFIMGPVSDMDAPSGVTNHFVIRGGKEKIKVYSYQGSLQNKQTIFIGEF